MQAEKRTLQSDITAAAAAKLTMQTSQEVRPDALSTRRRLMQSALSL
jgi:hypothetical protein